MTQAYVDDLIRTFVALKVSPELVAAVLRIQKRAGIDLPRGLRWTNPEQAHMTLAFLGDTPSESLPALEDIVTEAAAGFAPFLAEVHGIGGFPRAQRPRVIWAGVAGDSVPRFAAMHDFLWSGIMPIRPKPKPDDRPFHPHITLARVPGPQPPRLAEWMARHADWHFGAWPVREISLMRSVLTPTGPVYETIVEAPLTGDKD